MKEWIGKRVVVYMLHGNRLETFKATLKSVTNHSFELTHCRGDFESKIPDTVLNRLCPAFVKMEIA